jgi:hypothetical protein
MTHFKYLKFISLLLVATLFEVSLGAQEINKEKSSYKIVPIVSSNPTAGTGAGVMGALMYKADEKSSPSQAIISAQYTDTDSYNLFIINKLFFDSDQWQSNSVYAHIFNNSSFLINGEDYGFGGVFEPNLEVTIDAALQQFLYLLQDNLYIGGQAFYIKQNFEALNQEGEFFLRNNGIESSQRAGLGATLSYDTRSKEEKFYPRNSLFINLSFNYFPQLLDTTEDFSNLLINARKYFIFGKPNDVVALQFMGQYCSKSTPDGALAALGARNILRGFPIGKYKTRYLSAAQAEYRYTIKNSRFRVVPFAGFANLSGGSQGTQTGNRDKDNGNYCSGGFGIHYILEKKHQLDYRVDLVYNNDDETSIYASLNQAF